ncbi:MAG TPA: hypothetical protein VHE30_02885 [Polyangiaceae bacterium]|nr:hypothetical protein [Polyangiaceae bacterium]
MTAAALLDLLLREGPVRSSAETLADYWAETASLRARFPSPVERAVSGGFAANRVGFAFAAGYQAALRALVPSLPAEGLASFCVTEKDGNHPRAIHTTFHEDAGVVTVRGEKRWAVAAATMLVLVGRVGEKDGRPLLRALRVDVPCPGVVVSPSPPGPFVPEVLHATLRLDGARVPAAALLPGDGYDDYTKPFRTIEDLLVQAALLGYLASVSVRAKFPREILERAVSLVVAARGLAELSPKEPTTHVALAGFLSQTTALFVEADASFFALADAPERERWTRDRVLSKVAGKARELRRDRAFESLEKAR